MPQTKAGAARNPWLQYMRSLSQDSHEAGAAMTIKPYVLKHAKTPSPATVAAVEPKKDKGPQANAPKRRVEAAACRQPTLLLYDADALVCATGSSQIVSRTLPQEHLPKPQPLQLL